MSAWLYYSENRTPLTTPQDFLLSHSYQRFTIDLSRLDVPAQAIGEPIGIEFDNVSDQRDLQGDVEHAWLGLDNVSLAITGGAPGDVTGSRVFQVGYSSFGDFGDARRRQRRRRGRP